MPDIRIDPKGENAAMRSHPAMNPFRRHLLCSALFVAIGTCGAMTDAHARQAADTRSFDVPAQSAVAALNVFAEQADITLVFSQDLVQGITTHPLQGSYTTADGLQAMLEGTGLSIQEINGATISIGDGSRADASGASAAASQDDARTLASVTVTGTRIRGGSTPSPVVTVGSEQIRQEGFTDLGEVVRSIPQNFSGGQNPGVSLGASQGSPSNQNITGGSGMNLRGLGPDATLTLLNGRRMAYGGFSQAVDISAIPVDAVERLEVVPDGASAIYGSDAVGGVANVILKPDFDGVTVRARYGEATEGGLTTHEYTATAGTTWATGGLLVAGKKSSNDPIYSDQRDYTRSMYGPAALWQGSDLRSGVLSLHQSLGETVELHVDALGNNRESHTALAYPATYHPYDVKTRATLLSPSLQWWLPGDWTLTFSAAVGEEKNSVAQPTVNRVDGAITSGGLVAYRNKSRTYEIGAEGPLFALPGGDARLAAGAGYRYNDLLYRNLSKNTVTADGDESSRFAYAELSLPLIGPQQGVAGVERLELTGAIRAEDGDYGSVTTPKLGVIYSPSVDFSLKASWGKSFKAPTLVQRHFNQNAIYYPASTFGAGYPADATALWLSGGNVNLRPERARTWSASLALHPEAISGLEAELTWFDIDYTERVRQPITSFNVFGNPIYTDFVHYDPDATALAEAVANADNFSNNVGAPFDPATVVAIVDGRYVNTARQRIKGVDLSGSYLMDLGPGQLTVRGSASWLDSEQSLTATQNPYDLAGTLFNPARINSRVGAVWQQGGFTASLFGNYVGGVTNTLDEKKGSSFTTFDTTLRYDTGARGDAWSNLALELSMQNMFDRAPPLFIPTSWTYTPYDPANYSAMGRFLSLSVSKHW